MLILDWFTFENKMYEIYPCFHTFLSQPWAWNHGPSPVQHKIHTHINSHVCIYLYLYPYHVWTCITFLTLYLYVYIHFHANVQTTVWYSSLKRKRLIGHILLIYFLFTCQSNWKLDGVKASSGLQKKSGTPLFAGIILYKFLSLGCFSEDVWALWLS